MHSRVSWSVLYNYMMPILSSFFSCSYKCMKILVWALPIIDEKSYLFPWRSACPVGAVKRLMGKKLQCESWDTRFECPELQSLLALTLEYKRAEPGHCWAEITPSCHFFPLQESSWVMEVPGQSTSNTYSLQRATIWKSYVKLHSPSFLQVQTFAHWEISFDLILVQEWSLGFSVTVFLQVQGKAQSHISRIIPFQRFQLKKDPLELLIF